MNKAYERVNWQNSPSEATALNDVNLNKMDAGIDEIDDRVVAHDTRLTNDESAIETLQNGKVDKEAGKGLSTFSAIGVSDTKNTGNKIADIVAIDQSGNTYHNVIKDGVVNTISPVIDAPVSGSAVYTALTNKVDKVSGKGLSANDYTDADKTKLAGISEGATAVSISDTLEEGETLATITIDGTPTEIKGSTVEVDDELSDVSENPVQNKVVTTELENKADADGNYEDMAVGQLLSNTFEEDKAPYNFRTSGGTLEIGDREYDTLVGGTVAWNQLINPSNWDSSDSDFVDGIKFTKNNDNSLTITIAEGGALAKRVYRLQANATFPDHKVYGGKIGISGITLCNAYSTDLTQMSDSIYRNTRTSANQWRLCICVQSGTGAGTYTIKPQLFDLTQMFGSTIADYIYSLEQATAGSGVAYFRSLFPKDYYAYNAGQLMSVKALSHKMVGFNAFNVTTGKAKLLGGNRYQITGTYTALSYSTGETLTPDSNGKFTPSASGELTVTGGDNTTCVHLVWDGERDGEYEAYEEHIYPLDSDLELRGIPKLDANNNLYYDGDTYESDGTVTRKYGFRAYQSGDEGLADAITDGTNTVYKLTTPTTETADAFENPQLVDNWGTEEYTDSREVQIPVGHITKYPPDLKAKLESAPDSPASDGDYILRHNNGENTYVALTKELPAVPTTDGNYVLGLTVSSGVATLSWVADTATRSLSKSAPVEEPEEVKETELTDENSEEEVPEDTKDAVVVKRFI